MQKSSNDRNRYRTGRKKANTKKVNINKTKLIWTCVAGTAAVLLIVFVVLLINTIGDAPGALGVEDIYDPSVTPYDIDANVDNLSEEELALRTLMDKGIVNVLLVGVDTNEERERIAQANPDATKTDMHSDAMIILAINFKENKVDMISLPRDTFTYIPGVSGSYNGNGIYKLNAAINCGEKPYPQPESFEKLLESAEWMLGGKIPINYYFSVDMPAVIGLVDAIGGIEYEVDVDFYGGKNSAGQDVRPYTKGLQKMDGQAVLDYLRTRKSSITAEGELGDLNRINRQKNMLKAIFSQMKKSGDWLKVPQILASFSGKYHTNLNTIQVLALANWAYKLNEEDDIGMCSMDGSMRYGLFHWNFCVTDQEKRVKIIKDIYGIDVQEYKEYSVKYVTDYWCNIAGNDYRANAQAFYNKYNVDPKEIIQSPKPSPSDSISPSLSPAISNSPEKNPSPSPSPTEDDGEQIGFNVRNNGYQLLSIAAPSPTPSGVKYDYSECFTEKEREKIEAVLNSKDVFKIQAVCEEVNSRFKFKFPKPWGPNPIKDNQIKVNFN